MRASSVFHAAPVALLLALSAGPASADEFLQQEGTLWRSSKLVGVDLFGPGNQKVGAISDVLMGQDGKVAYVVVGVGGFLGIGEKDVAIPFDKVTFSQDPMPRPAAPAHNAGASAAMGPADSPAAGGAALGDTPASTEPVPAPTAALGAPAPASGGSGTDAPAGEAMTTPLSPRSSAYPNHGMIDLTADQLKAAPAFTYAK